MICYGRLIFFTLLLAVRGQNEGLNNFITLAMEDLPQWLRQHQLDEFFHSVSLNTSKPNLQIYGDIPSQRVFNLSNLITLSVNSNLLEGTLDVHFLLNDLCIAQGDYKLEGNVLSTIPVTGSGRSEMKLKLDWYLTIEKFSITQDGYIDISEAEKRTTVYTETVGFIFEGLNAQGFENIVLEALGPVIKSQTQEATGDFLKAAVTQYFVEIFAKTPLSEIIGTTSRPPTTTTEDPEITDDSPSTTTARPPTTTAETRPPCLVNNEKIIEEKIIEEKLTSIDGEDAIVVTKIVKVIKKKE